MNKAAQDIAALQRLTLKKAAKVEKARRDFRAYRRLINPGLKDGWFRQEAEKALQDWWEKFRAGLRPVLLLSTPPQHGKSILIIDFISWVAGQDPSLRQIFGSYSDRLGVRANLRLQRIFDSEIYRKIFPGTRISGPGSAVAGHLRNREVLEFIDKGGFFRNVTVGGSITGDSADIGYIDDPIKGREEANSETMREKVWQWYTDDFGTRFSDHAGLILIMTRWSTDDIAARIIENDPTAEVLNFPAIAEHDEEHRKEGEPLFPELKSLAFLLGKKRLMRQASWKSLYQGSPIIDEGEMFHPDLIKIVKYLPTNITQRVRYWDKAGTDGGGAFSAGAQLALAEDNRVFIVDMRRAQVSAGRREQLIRQTADLDGQEVHVWTEQEPGSGGKESAENTIKNLAGYTARAEPVTGSKVVRAEPLAAYIDAGNVYMLEAPWNKELIDEMRLFPNGKYKDQVDACSGAFNKLTLGQVDTGMLDFMREESARREKERTKTPDNEIRTVIDLQEPTPASAYF